MRMRWIIASLLFSGTTLLAPAQQNATTQPVVVELFTAEGCSSCPPADKLLADFVAANGAGHPEIIALGEHVDYWNHEGWTDRFSSAAFSHRQEVYGEHFKIDAVYTPQMVIDGKTQVSGNDRAAAVHGILAEAAQAKPAKVDVHWESATRLHVAVQSEEQAQVLLAMTEDGLSTEVKDGENRGRTLQHTGVVRELRELGNIKKNEFATSIDLPAHPGWNRDKMKFVVLVQRKNQGAIIGVATVSGAAAPTS